jgi:hypothetical protein
LAPGSSPTKPPCPAFWGVAPRNMKTGTEDSKACFRIKLEMIQNY